MSSKWKGIPEGQKGKGHEGHCAQTRISPVIIGMIVTRTNSDLRPILVV